MTEPNDPAAEIRARTAARRAVRAERVARQGEVLRKAIAKSKAAGRGGARPNSGRKPLFTERGTKVFSFDPVTLERLASCGESGERSKFLREALAHLCAELAADASLPLLLAERMPHDDPAQWPDAKVKATRPFEIVAPAALLAIMAPLCKRGTVFASPSQFARVAVTREMARRMVASPEVPKP